MEEDDMDFIPSQNTSSYLSSLFGFTKKPLQGNSSLTYTAPKAPKGESSLAKKIPEEKTKSKIIFSKAVHAYKLENRTYISQGLIGIVISGNHDSKIYEIILYNRNKEHLCQTRISSNFTITLSPNNYVSFYDNSQQNWSLMFQSSADAEQFSQKVAICKFYSHTEQPTEALIQDVTPPSQPKAVPNSIVDVVYNGYALIPEEISKLKEDIKEQIKLSTYNFMHLSKSLVGCGENCKRVIIIPHSLGGPWLSDLNPHKDLLLEVKLERIVPEVEITAPESKPLKEGPESPVDSSAEETNVKAKGASIKEALSSTKSQKANLISRMARMGQATLPLKPGQSDSEEENMLMSSPKPRIPRNRMASSSPTVNSSCSQTSHAVEPSQQLSVYQNDLSWHQSQLNKPGVVYQQLIPVSASPVASPTTDPNLSVYVSESRVQAAELRMGISKMSEKLDLIWNKMQNTGGEYSDISKRHQMALLDSGGILSSVQNLIKENENLKEKVEEQKGKLEQQNDRIFHLLELNHKYLEQNSTTHEKQSESELKMKTEMESLHRKELELEETNRRALEKVKGLTEDLAKSEEVNRELKKRLEESKAEAEVLKKNIEGSNDIRKSEAESFQEKLSKASGAIIKMEERLKEITSENENLRSVIKSQKEEIETGHKEIRDSETKRKEYEKAVESLKKQISDEEVKTESKIDGLSKVVAKLEEENKCLLEKIQKQDTKGDMNSMLPQVLSRVKDHFSNSKEYSGSEIAVAVEKIFRNVIDGKAEFEEKSEAPVSETKQNVVPAPRKSRQNLETSEKEKGAKELIKEEKEAKELVKEEKEAKELVKEEKDAKELVKEEKDAKELVKEEKEAEKEGKEEAKEETSVNRLPANSDSKEEQKNETDDQKKKEEIDSRYKSYDQGWRTTKPPPPPLFDDEDDVDDWLN